MSLMGVDIGSSSCKAVVFDAAGKVLSFALEEYTAQFLGAGRVEMDPEELRRGVMKTISRAAFDAKEPIEAVGLSSHGESFLALNERGEPLGPAIMNVDSRASEEARWWEAQLGRKRIFETTGLIAHPMYPMAKLRWMRIHEPELFESAARFASFSEYVLLKLGLEPILPYPLAGRFMAFDVRRLTWSEEILALAELTKERLPRAAPSGALAGRLSREAAREIGLPPGTPVAAAGHDQPCGALGMGAIEPGMVTNSLGTYECLVAVTERPTLAEEALKASVNSYCHAAPGKYITIAYFPSGIMVRWFCENFCGEDSAAARAAKQDLYEYLESRTPKGPTNICVTPHLIGSANPHFDPQATGAIVGLTQTTTRAQLYKAILEGLACEFTIVAELLAKVVGEFATVRCTGGGARSRVGLQLRATISGKDLQTLFCPEAVCLGAALLAGTTAGVYGSLKEAVGATVKVKETVAPVREQREQYRRQVERYRLLYPALAPIREV